MANQNNPQIAVIGSGYWGRNLVRNYYDIGALSVVCDKNEAVLEQFKKQYPDTDICFAYADVLARDDIKGVVIATPAETHYLLAIEALHAGKHVYVEKPLVLDEAQGAELIDTAQEKGLTLMVGHLLQYHPVFIRLRELAASGVLGRINYIYSNRLNLGKIRREENILWSFAPHDISMILCLAGEKPEKIHASGGYFLHKKIADVTVTHLEFPSGLQAHIFVSWLHPFKEQKLVVVGEKKMAVFDDTLPWQDKLLIYPHEIKWQQGMPVPEKAQAERIEIPEAEPLRQECIHFLECIKTGCTPRTDGKEGLEVLKILNKAQRSLDTGTRLPESSEPIHDRRPEITGSFIHHSAVIDSQVEIGTGTKIWHFSHILKQSSIGENCNIGQNVVIGPKVNIGRGCKIQNNVSVYEGVTLEDYVFCGPSMVFTNIFSPRSAIPKMDMVKPTLVKKHATLGANCTLVCGVTIGEYAFIGAGAVVTKDVPGYALVAGNPARQIGWVSRHGERLDFPIDEPMEARCPGTGELYILKGTTVELKENSG